ncbi:MAG: hypothetical protein DI591_08475 [Citromicrobium sp.]|nr:MAG: hypothetical protein DI591_08475 [Citromicrobium sp.]
MRCGDKLGRIPGCRARYEASQTAVMSMGGMSYAEEYHVERYLREVLIPRSPL